MSVYWLYLTPPIGDPWRFEHIVPKFFQVENREGTLKGYHPLQTLIHKTQSIAMSLICKSLIQRSVNIPKSN